MQRLFLLVVTTCGCNLITGADSLRECEGAECASVPTGAGGSAGSTTSSGMGGGGPTAIDVEEIGTGRHSTCVTLLPERTPWCWGEHTGDGTADTHTTPVQVNGPVGGLSQLVHGVSHHCGIGALGEVYCWGNNDFGQLGTGDNRARREPTLVAGTLPPIARLSTAGMHTCALSDGTPPESFCWGWNAHGQLGTGDTMDRNAPTPINVAPTEVIHQGCGFAYSCAVTVEGVVYCWGLNNQGQLGVDPTMTPMLDNPTLIQGLPDLERIYPGYEHTCGRTAIDRKLLCWGSNDSGQLGNGMMASTHMPQSIDAIAKVDVAYPGVGHTCVLDAGTADEGILWCWGNNDHGQLTDMAANPQLEPLQIGIGVTRFSGKASNHICFGAADSIGCVGLNDSGQLGRGTYESTGDYEPVQF
ncbi:MAG TPA: hypothetical protein VFB62_27715 [Polyangiaceae bacterium]|nr:hypothetical protein [Polyangiaceae bacterium]